MSDEDALRLGGEHLVAYLNEQKIELGTEATGLFNPNHAYGTADDATRYVARLIEAGADEVMFLIQMGRCRRRLRSRRSASSARR